MFTPPTSQETCHAQHRIGRSSTILGALHHRLGQIGETFQACYEASAGYGWLYDQLRPPAARVVVAYPGQLRRSLLSGAYQPGAIRRVWIPKPGGGERGLGIPNVVDRVVQQALLQVLEPVFEPTLHDSSHGFRPRRGAQTAIACLHRLFCPLLICWNRAWACGLC